MMIARTLAYVGLCLFMLLGASKATLDTAYRVSALTTGNCLALHAPDIWDQLVRMCEGKSQSEVATALYQLTGALRAGRPLCAAMVSASAQVYAVQQRQRAECETSLGRARGRQQFAPGDAIFDCLKVAQRSVILALVQTPEEEAARQANVQSAKK